MDLRSWLSIALPSAQRQREQAAVMRERRRLAREIHDGMAQDLAFIAQQADALSARAGADERLNEIATAARRALDEARLATDVLSRPPDEPLDEALARVAAQASGRWGAVAETHAAPGLQLPVAEREALLRIVGEAVTNAARHARPRRIRVEIGAQPSRHVRIHDDGIGFDPAAGLARGSHGLAVMRERAEQVGGRLRVASAPGAGTEILVVLP
jgi:signal transduction histidine kinase